MDSMARWAWICGFVFTEGAATWFLYVSDSFKEPHIKKSDSEKDLDWYWAGILCAAPLNLWALFSFFVPLESIIKGKGFTLEDLGIMLLMLLWMLIVIVLQFPTRFRAIFYKDSLCIQDSNSTSKKLSPISKETKLITMSKRKQD